LREIDTALLRIRSGDYGYCEITGEEIGIARLRACPTARLCCDAQTRREREARLRGQLN
jgi:DnaK suppressor protein